MAKKGEKVIHSEETRKKISDGVQRAYDEGRLIHWSKLHPEAFHNKKGFHGRKHSEETKAKVSQNRKGKDLGNTHGFTKGHMPWNKDKPHRVHNAEWRAKVSKATSGPNHWNWKGGVDSFNRLMRSSSKHKQWAKAVYERDNWTCQSCGKHCQRTEIIAHHIISWKKNSILRFDVSNGITLCRECHCFLHKPRLGTAKPPKPQLS